MPLLLALSAADVGDDGGGLQAAKGFAQQLVLVAAGVAGRSSSAGRRAGRAACAAGRYCRCLRRLFSVEAAQIRISASQIVAMPNSGVREHVDENLAVRADIFDRLQALALGQAEKRPLHRLALIAQRQVRDIRDEQIELRVGERRAVKSMPFSARPVHFGSRHPAQGPAGRVRRSRRASTRCMISPAS